MLLIIFVCFFEFGFGSVAWIYMSEVATEKGFSIAVSLNWLASLLISFLPQIFGRENFKYYCFSSCATMLTFFLISLYCLKETKGLKPAEVVALYTKRGNRKKGSSSPLIEERNLNRYLAKVEDC